MQKLVPTLILGATAGALGSSHAGPAARAQAFGAYPSHVTEDSYQISIGVTAGGNHNRDRRQTELRETVVVPEHYGTVVAVTPAQGAAVVWYQDEHNVLRNVILTEPESRLYRLEPHGTDSREVRLIP
jgi:hypothetical protein